MGHIKKCHPDLVELYAGTHPMMALPMSMKPVKIQCNQDPLIIVEEKASETITTSSPTHADVAPEMLSMPTLREFTAQVCDEPAVIPLKAPTTEITETVIPQPESKVHFPDNVLDIEIEELFGLDTSRENSAPDLPQATATLPKECEKVEKETPIKPSPTCLPLKPRRIIRRMQSGDYIKRKWTPYSRPRPTETKSHQTQQVVASHSHQYVPLDLRTQLTKDKSRHQESRLDQPIQ